MRAAIAPLIVKGWVEDTHGPFQLVLVSPTLLLNVGEVDAREVLLKGRAKAGVMAGSRGYVEWVIAVNGEPAWWGPYSGYPDVVAERRALKRLERLWDLVSADAEPLDLALASTADLDALDRNGGTP